MNNYNVTFTIDGSLTVEADSPDEAERKAVDAVECMDMFEDHTVDGCLVQVVLEFEYDEDDEPDNCNKVDRPAHVVEFA